MRSDGIRIDLATGFIFFQSMLLLLLLFDVSIFFFWCCRQLRRFLLACWMMKVRSIRYTASSQTHTQHNTNQRQLFLLLFQWLIFIPHITKIYRCHRKKMMKKKIFFSLSTIIHATSIVFFAHTMRIKQWFSR